MPLNLPQAQSRGLPKARGVLGPREAGQARTRIRWLWKQGHHTSPWSHLCETSWRLMHSQTWARTTLSPHPPSTQHLVQSVVAVTSYSNCTPLVSPLDCKLFEG